MTIPADFSIPRFDWSSWDQLNRKTQREIRKELADAIAAAPLDVQAAIILALSRKGRGKKGSAKPPVFTGPQRLIIDEHERAHGPVNVSEKLEAFRTRYNRPVRDDWQETRKALLVAAVDEVNVLRGKGLPAHLARQFVAGRYSGLSLGLSSSKGKPVKLRIGPTLLWKAAKALARGSPDALHMDLWLCGRRKV